MPEVLRGTLGAVHLGSLLQLIEAEGLSGALRFDLGGQLDLNNGEITGATCGPLTGYTALRTLFFVERGDFSLQTGAPSDARALVPTVRAVMDGMRLLDEWARIGPMVLEPVGPPGELPSPADRVVAALDGKTALQQVILKEKASPAQVVDALLEMIEAGTLMEVSEPVTLAAWPGPSALGSPSATAGATAAASPSTQAARPAAVTDSPEAFDAALEDGRKLLRNGLFDDAEEAFLRAINIRPDDRIAGQNLRRVRQLRDAPGAAWLRPKLH